MTRDSQYALTGSNRPSEGALDRQRRVNEKYSRERSEVVIVSAPEQSSQIMG